jgi:Spy/CpxP family protein refolding chaperone
MKRFIVVSLLALGLAVGFSASVAAQPMPGPGPGGPDPLNLTLKQRQKVAELRAATMKKVAVVEANLKVKHLELRALWLTDHPKRDAILKKMAEMDPLEASLREAWVDFELAFRKLLTPAQRKLHLEHGPGPMGPRMGHRFGHGPGMGPGMGRGMGPGMGRGMGPGMGRGMGRGMGPGMGRGMGPGCPWGPGPGPGAPPAAK